MPALFIQDFKAHNFDINPLPSTVKAHFIHTARDLDYGTGWYNPGPDYASGYGVLDIKAAIDQLRLNGWTEGCVDQGQTDTYQFSIPGGTSQIKVTLVWDDEPASPGTTAPALVNDLDLVVTDAAGVRRYPWILNPASPSASAVRNAEDHLNNVEVVLADGSVPSGIWTVQVRGTTVPSGPQCYSLVYSPVYTPLLPDLVVAELTGPSQVTPGEHILVRECTANVGTRAWMGTSKTNLYWSTNATYDPGVDLLLAQRTIFSRLTPGETPDCATGGQDVWIPATASPGTYYIIAVADATGVVPETSETNNTKYLQVTVNPVPVGTLQFSSATYSVNENGGSILITVTRTGGSSGAVGVSYATSNGSATAGSD